MTNARRKKVLTSLETALFGSTNLPSVLCGLALRAALTSSTVMYVTDPKPLEGVVFRSFITTQSVSVPLAQNGSSDFHLLFQSSILQWRASTALLALWKTDLDFDSDLDGSGGGKLQRCLLMGRKLYHILNYTYRWHHIIFLFLCLTYYIQYDNL